MNSGLELSVNLIRRGTFYGVSVRPFSPHKLSFNFYDQCQTRQNCPICAKPLKNPLCASGGARKSQPFEIYDALAFTNRYHSWKFDKSSSLFYIPKGGLFREI